MVRWLPALLWHELRGHRVHWLPRYADRYWWCGKCRTGRGRR